MKQRISLDTLKKYLIIFAFIPPGCSRFFDELEIVVQFLALCRYVISGIVILGIFIKPQKFKSSWNFFTIACTLFCLLEIISIKMNGTYYLTGALSCITVVGFVFWNMSFWNQNKFRFLLCYRRLLFFYFTANFFTQIFLPNGFIKEATGDNRVYFMGDKNAVSIYAIFYIFCLFLEYRETEKINKNKIIRRLLILNLYLIINNSSTAIIVIWVIQLYIGFTYFVKHRLHSKARIVSTFSLFLGIALTVFFMYSVVFSGEEASWLKGLTSTFGKTITFSGRVDIWKVAREYIRRFPIWGQGMDVMYDAWGNWHFVYSAHNTFLDVGVKYGVFTMTIIIGEMLYLLAEIWRTKKYRDNEMILIIFIGLLIALQFESLGDGRGTWLLMSTIYLSTRKDDVYSNKKYYMANRNQV